MTDPQAHTTQVLTTTLQDPIVQTLLKYSNLTKIQFESLLISLFGEESLGRRLSGQERARLRLEKANITRGSFNRTVAQARQNVAASIYTILLLGYVGLFDTPQLEPFLEIADRIKRYAEEQSSVDQEIRGEGLRATRLIGEELQQRIVELVRGPRRRAL